MRLSSFARAPARSVRRKRAPRKRRAAQARTEKEAGESGIVDATLPSERATFDVGLLGSDWHARVSVSAKSRRLLLEDLRARDAGAACG